MIFLQSYASNYSVLPLVHAQDSEPAKIMNIQGGPADHTHHPIYHPHLPFPLNFLTPEQLAAQLRPSALHAPPPPPPPPPSAPLATIQPDLDTSSRVTRLEEQMARVNASKDTSRPARRSRPDENDGDREESDGDDADEDENRPARKKKKVLRKGKKGKKDRKTSHRLLSLKLEDLNPAERVTRKELQVSVD